MGSQRLMILCEESDHFSSQLKGRLMQGRLSTKAVMWDTDENQPWECKVIWQLSWQFKVVRVEMGKDERCRLKS